MQRFALVALVACHSPSSPTIDAVGSDGPLGDSGVSIDWVCSQQFGARVCEATLDPTSLGPGIEHVLSQGENGRHYVCRPEAVTSFNGKLLVHLVGTGSDPATDHRLVQLGCSLGFVGVAPMYKNADDSRSVCGDSGPCYEDFHREIVNGGDRISGVSVDVPNSVLSRLDSMLEALAASDVAFPPWPTLRDAVVGRDWRSVVTSGHSQGSGHALFLARDLAVERVVMLSGVNDRTGSNTPSNGPVPWIDQFGTVTKTPGARALGFVHMGDSVAIVPQLLDNWDRIGVGTQCDWVSAGGYQPNCRRIVITTPSCTGLRAHVSTVLAEFGAGCLPGGSIYANQATWTFLLGAPLP